MQQAEVSYQDCDSVFIRHAQSNFNKGGLTYVYQKNLHHLGWLDLIQNQQFNKAVTYNPLYIDPHITQHGVQQCHLAKIQFTPEDFDLILVSPQLRALQTCGQIFGFENKNVIVHPLATEVVRYSCDISHTMDSKMEQFPHYNFDEMKNWTDQWYFHVLSQEKLKICQQYFHEHNIHDFKGRQLAVIQLLSKQIIAESAKQLRQRVGRLKQLIKKIKEQKKANKIAVISHHYTTQCLLSPGFDENDEVVNIGEIINGRPYFRKLEDVLNVK